MTQFPGPEGSPEPVIYPRDQHNVSRSKIDSDALSIMYRLVRSGYKAYLVGGGVRDVVLGKIPKDFDIATDATPRQVKSLFRNSRIIGRRFKLVHIFFPSGKNIEVSTFRDISVVPESDEGAVEASTIAQDNKFGTESTDAIRRDITINALFYDISTYSIIDYVGGMEDLRSGIVRVIGDPDVRFAEDPVRLIRVIRHAARNGFQIESHCYKSILKNLELLKTASQVRVFEEVKKDLVSGSILSILRLLSETRLLSLLVPALSPVLLAEGAHLPICLERVDEAGQAGQEVSATVVLTLLALYVPGKDEDPAAVNVHERFSSEDQLSEHIKYVFSNLVVPRKERERIEGLIHAWDRACRVHGPVKVGALVRGTDIDDLITLYTAIHGDDEDDVVLNALKDHDRKKSSRTRQPQRKSRPRREARA